MEYKAFWELLTPSANILESTRGSHKASSLWAAAQGRWRENPACGLNVDVILQVEHCWSPAGGTV